MEANQLPSRLMARLARSGGACSRLSSMGRACWGQCLSAHLMANGWPSQPPGLFACSRSVFSRRVPTLSEGLPRCSLELQRAAIVASSACFVLASSTHHKQDTTEQRRDGRGVRGASSATRPVVHQAWDSDPHETRASSRMTLQTGRRPVPHRLGPPAVIVISLSYALSVALDLSVWPTCSLHV